MKVLRLQNRTPSVYTEESRDFQLLTRLYDCIFNGMLFDSKTIPDMLSTENCRSSLMSLLQTKLGFFTIKEYEESSIRSVLEGFPTIVKNKGSVQSIIYAVNCFLKLNNIFSTVVITYQKEPLTLANGYEIPPRTLIIGIQSSLQDTSLLEEVFRYIIPAGIGYYFYFFSSYSEIQTTWYSDSADILYISNNLNSQLRLYTFDEFEDPMQNRVTGAVDTVSILTDVFANSEDALGDVIPMESNISPKYNAGNNSLFLGVHYHETYTVSQYVTNVLQITPVTDNAIVFNDEHYVYISSNWQKLNFVGNVNQNPTGTYSNGDTVQSYDIVYNITDSKYYIYLNTSWVENEYPIYLFTDGKEVGES